nr:MAG TPA: hypothetical protein [Caudoviricetes sp.]
MSKRKKKAPVRTETKFTRYIPQQFPDAFKPSEMLSDAEWWGVARIVIRLRRIA